MSAMIAREKIYKTGPGSNLIRPKTSNCTQSAQTSR